MTKFNKLLKVVDKVLVTVDLEKLKDNRLWMIMFVLTFILSIFLGPLAIVAVIGFMAGIR